ncbi:MAG: hypothetical protein V4528_14960 [Pseudomonadota bacterium]
MVRAIDRDFESLNSFLEGYTLREIGHNVEQVKIVKAAHKSYLPFLQFWAICSDETAKNNFSIFSQPVLTESQEFSHLREAVSDIGSGLFCCLHGAYKPGHMALRSSIENYLRFSSGAFDKTGITTTSIYELFDIARKTDPFYGNREIYLDRLRSSYVELCKFSHSASLAHMAGIHALAHFPAFDTRAFQGWLAFAKKCMSAMATVTFIGQPSLYLNAHFKAQELIDLLIPTNVRLSLLNGKCA